MAQKRIASTALLAQVQKRLRSGAADSASTVIWKEGDSQVGVAVGSTWIRLTTGWLVVDVPLCVAEAGAPASVQAIFFLGRPGEQAGLGATTTLTGTAPPLLIDRWGRKIQVAVWNAIQDLLAGALKESGATRLSGYTADENALVLEVV